VIDLPEVVQALVTEHLLISRRCSCGTVTCGPARLQSFGNRLRIQ
jgi:hypothetical protein